MKLSRTLLSAAAAAALSAASFSASAVDFTLNQTFTAGLVGPFGTVTLTQDGANEVDVMVMLNSPFQFVETGGPHDAFTFNIKNTVGAYTVTAITPNAYSNQTPGTNPSFGSFTNGITCTACGNGGSNAFTSSLSFSVGAATGISVNDFVANGLGYYFTADVLSKVSLGGNGTTGAVGSSVPVTPVPEPETYALMLAGLGVVGFMANRRRKQA
jgi:hypothetical protein